MTLNQASQIRMNRKIRIHDPKAIVNRWDKFEYNKLEYLSIMAITAMIMTLIWGWNGSSGIIFACCRMGVFGYIFLVIGIGPLLMEEYYGWQKVLQFVLCLIFGYIASVLFTMRQYQRALIVVALVNGIVLVGTSRYTRGFIELVELS